MVWVESSVGRIVFWLDFLNIQYPIPISNFQRCMRWILGVECWLLDIENFVARCHWICHLFLRLLQPYPNFNGIYDHGCLSIASRSCIHVASTDGKILVRLVKPALTSMTAFPHTPKRQLSKMLLRMTQSLTPPCSNQKNESPSNRIAAPGV